MTVARPLLMALPVVAALSLAACAGSDQPATPPLAVDTGVTVTRTLAEGLTSPWGLAFLPDGSALVSERDTSVVKRIHTGDGERVSVVGTVPGVSAGGEGGLLGLAVPDDPDPREVYAYVTTATDNRVLRIAWDGERLGTAEPILTGIPRADIHDGGRLRFGPDGYLYVSTGDAGDGARAQDPADLGGKILRITTTGKPAPGNPDPDSPVWSLGHRNVQGLDFDDDGRLWAAEFGQSDVDEVNLVTAGGNYGWPQCEGACDRPGLQDPAVQWSPTAIASPSGLAVLGDALYVASLRGEVLYRIPVAAGTAGTPTRVDLGDLGRLRTVEAAPDGSLWLVTSNTDGRGDPRDGDDRVLRLSAQ